MAARVLNKRLVAVGRGSDTRHALHDIEHGALNLQERQLLPIHSERHIAGLHRCAVLQVLLHAALRVEIADNLLRDLYARQDTFFFDNQLLTSHLSGRDTTERGMVTVAYVFFKPKRNQFAQFLCLHVKLYFIIFAAGLTN